MAVRTTQLSERAVRVVEPTVSRGRAWTVRDSVALSSRRTLTAAAAIALITLVTAASSRVLFMTALAIVGLIPAVLVDIIERRLPDRLVALAAVGGAIGMTIDVAVGRHTDVGPLIVDAAIGAVVMAGPVLAVHLVSPMAMGFGDVKLAVALGTALGPISTTSPLVALALACAGSAIVGGLRRQPTIAFGPGLLVGAVAVLAIAASPLDIVHATSPLDTTTRITIRSAITLEGAR